MVRNKMRKLLVLLLVQILLTVSDYLIIALFLPLKPGQLILHFIISDISLNCLHIRYQSERQFIIYLDSLAGLSCSVGCAVRLETKRSRVQPHRVRQHSFVEIDHEIFSTVILSPPLSFWQKNVHILVNRLED